MSKIEELSSIRLSHKHLKVTHCCHTTLVPSVHNEFHDLHSTPTPPYYLGWLSKEILHVSRVQEKRNIYKIFMERTGKCLPEIPRRKKLFSVHGMGCRRMYIHLADDMDNLWALVNTVINIRVPKSVGKFFTTWGIISLSRMNNYTSALFLFA